VVETIRLESGHTLTGIVGSNPTLSAIFFAVRDGCSGLRSMRRGWQVVCLAAVLGRLTACVELPDGQVLSRESHEPDKVLFERAMTALHRHRLDVASLTLQTLVNTYPDSDYASKARILLEDPRLGECGESWHSFEDCDGERANMPEQSELEFFILPEPER
jgi:hypothetical protein